MKSFEERIDKFTSWSLYVLRCEGDYYYVGVSQTVHIDKYRIPQQFGEKKGFGSQADFCKIHQPLEVVQKVELGVMHYHEAEIIENAYTKIYAARYPGKVEGGITCLSDKKKQSLQADTVQEILNLNEIQ
ncbi:MAG: hypothetical protein IJ122_06265 [Methanobrevibacter sp.]|nr:hypothetical protein [Methanobrevibacter sp.]